MNGARLLLEGVFDYAGLFPPAALPLPVAVAHYAAYRRRPEAWMLGRFVVPLNQLDALDALVDALPPDDVASVWPLSVLGSGGIEDDRQQLALRAERRAGADVRTRVDSVEVKTGTSLEVRRARVLARDGWDVYCEPTLPPGDPAGEDDLDALLDAIAIAGLRAKLRAGGVQPQQIPPAMLVARVLAGCVQRGTSLKATAGLHHAVSGVYPLTDAADSPTAPMHGYLNLLVAAGVAEAAGAAAVRAPDVVQALANILALTRRPVFTAGGVLEWVDGHGPLTEGPLHQIAPPARALVRGIGSCSFDGPVADARALGLA